MRNLFKRVAIGVMVAATISLVQGPAQATQKKSFQVAWSIYAGWMPWGYAAEAAS
jgi:NitT/TauT family transport system substrate-binding protein